MRVGPEGGGQEGRRAGGEVPEPRGSDGGGRRRVDSGAREEAEELGRNLLAIRRAQLYRVPLGTVMGFESGEAQALVWDHTGSGVEMRAREEASSLHQGPISS